MKPILTLIALLLSAMPLLAQQEIADSIVQEGKRLYRSEMASWNGTDIILGKITEEDRKKVGGYFSYEKSPNEIICVFYSLDSIPHILYSVTFDSTFAMSAAAMDDAPRPLTFTEHEYFQIRNDAKKMVYSDSMFLHYKDIGMNIIPIIHNGEKKVYVLSGPKQSGIVVFGNDYLIRFDENNHVVGARTLHKNIIPIYYKNETETISSNHTHLPETGDYITATDICTLMLYEKTAHWRRHLVSSEKYISVWDCEKDWLIIITREALKKIADDKN